MPKVKKAQGAMVPGEGRLMSLLERVDGVMSAEGVTTVEMLLVARQMMLSAVVQLAQDNPQSDPLAVIDQVAESLRRSARASLHRPPMGMA